VVRAVTVLLLFLAAVGLAGCSGTQSAGGPQQPARSSGAAAARSAPATPAGPKRGTGTAVHVNLFEGDRQTYGVAMPIIAYFSHEVTDGTVFDKVTTVTVNG
jgi:hypothetical protein